MSTDLINILPGTRTLLRCLRVALIIVALLILCCSVVQMYNCNLLWVKIISGMSMIFNVAYIIFMLYLTSTKYHSTTPKDYNILFGFLLISTSASLIMFLCGGDYSLYEILGSYILLETERIILPSATIIFISITYWLPINSINRIYNKYNQYNRIKEYTKYGK